MQQYEERFIKHINDVIKYTKDNLDNHIHLNIKFNIIEQINKKNIKKICQYCNKRPSKYKARCGLCYLQLVIEHHNILISDLMYEILAE